jgi:dTDP-4-dehydrorhamnose 3,5-epimerase
MTITELCLPGLLRIEPDVHVDERGKFKEIWNLNTYTEQGLGLEFVQDNLSCSKPGVLRGLHFQNPHPQGKLIAVLQGVVYDVVVDIRPNSGTFGEWYGTELSAENAQQLYVPEGFAHGFAVTGSEDALFYYKCTAFYRPEAEGAIRWNDPDIGIDWPIENPNLSERDQKAESLSHIADYT